MERELLAKLVVGVERVDEQEVRRINRRTKDVLLVEGELDADLDGSLLKDVDLRAALDVVADERLWTAAIHAAVETPVRTPNSVTCLHCSASSRIRRRARKCRRAALRRVGRALRCFYRLAPCEA